MILWEEGGPSLRYLFSGKFYTEEEWSHPRRVIDSYEVLYVQSGEVYLEEEGAPYTLGVQQGFLLRPAVFMAVGKRAEGKPLFIGRTFPSPILPLCGFSQAFSPRRSLIVCRPAFVGCCMWPMR